MRLQWRVLRDKEVPSVRSKSSRFEIGHPLQVVVPGKSHITQSKVVNNQYNYGCIFCCTGNDPTPVFGGIDTLLQHLSSHQWQDIPAQVLHRAGCVIDRLCADDEEFDINVTPSAGMVSR